MFATSSSHLSNKFKTELKMNSSDENNTDTIYPTDTNIIKFTTSTTINHDENVWNNIKVINVWFSENKKFQLNILVIF
jgi:hypothetical protein